MHGILSPMPVLLLILSILLLGDAPARANVHDESATCLASYAVAEMPEPCWQVCIACHESTRPIQSLDIYQEGDALICGRCHPTQTLAGVGGNDFLLYQAGGGGGNHPVNVYYEPETARTPLHPDPLGPHLFYDANGERPKVQCSTCHNPMGRSPKLLWISNRGSALCIACHDK